GRNQQRQFSGQLFTFVNFEALTAKPDLAAAPLEQAVVIGGVWQAICQLFARTKNMNIHMSQIQPQLGSELIGIYPALTFGIQSLCRICGAMAGELQHQIMVTANTKIDGLLGSV